MSGSRSETTPATVCGRWAAMEPTEGCGCCTCAWALGWLMTPFFRAWGITGASESAGGSGGGPEAPPLPPFTRRGGAGSGTAGCIGRASQACLNQRLRRHDVRDAGRRLAGVRGERGPGLGDLRAGPPASRPPGVGVAKRAAEGKGYGCAQGADAADGASTVVTWLRGTREHAALAVRTTSPVGSVQPGRTADEARGEGPGQAGHGGAAVTPAGARAAVTAPLTRRCVVPCRCGGAAGGTPRRPGVRRRRARCRRRPAGAASSGRRGGSRGRS